jgi:hypothetical protein
MKRCDRKKATVVARPVLEIFERRGKIGAVSKLAIHVSTEHALFLSLTYTLYKINIHALIFTGKGLVGLVKIDARALWELPYTLGRPSVYRSN